MALQSPVWSPVTPTTMTESTLYRQRLEVIAEKLRLQEEIGAARRELEEEKLRVERLKRKSLRERWLMDGAAERPELQEDPASKDPQSPERQAQTRIRNLEDNLFTLQSQLQLLQSASTGAQHRPAGRPTWRRQGPRPLSQPTMEADPSGHKDTDKRTSLPAEAVSISPKSLSEPREEPVGVQLALRPPPAATGTSAEANGPCPGSGPLREQLSLRVAEAEGVTEAKGDDVVEVVWAGLRATEDCAVSPTSAELEAKVEEVVLGAIGDRQGTGSPELPTWVKEDRGAVEVVWEGVGGSASQAKGEVLKDASQASSLRLHERVKAEASRKQEGAPSADPEGDGRGGSVGEEGSFIWVERVTLGEDWEELLMEGLEGPVGTAQEGGPEALLEVGGEPGEESWEAGRRETEGTERVGRGGGVAKPGAGRDGAEVPLEAEGKGSEVPPERRGEDSRAGEEGGQESPGSEVPLQAELKRDKEKWETEAKEEEDPLQAEKGSEGEPSATEETGVAGRAGREKLLHRECEGEKIPGGETTGSEKPLEWEKKGESSSDGEATGGEKLLDDETEGEGSLDEERRESEKLLDEKTEGSEGSCEVEKTPGTQVEASLGEESKSLQGAELQVEDTCQVGTPLRIQEDPVPEEQGLQGSETEGSVGEAEAKPQPCAEGEGPPGDAIPLLAGTSAPELPAESQPLLQPEGTSANPSALPVPTYAPARQPESAAPTEGEEVSGPKQKTCQCCVVM